MLKRLILLGCENLRAIKWGSIVESQSKLEFVCIDTRPGTWAQQPPPALQHECSSRTLLLHAVLADVRLVRSLWNIIAREGKTSFDIQHGSYSAANNGEVVQCEATTRNEATKPIGVQGRHCLASRRYTDVLGEMGDTPMTPLMEAFPELLAGRSDRHVEITGGGHILERELGGHVGVYCLADVLQQHVESLHVHDASINMSMMTREWRDKPLRWLRVERCPNLGDSLFHLDVRGFGELEVVWVSELMMARCLWSKGHVPWAHHNMLSFGSLRRLCLRSCPRLHYVLPLRAYNALNNLETIHVVHCGDLRHIFPLGEGCQSEDITNKGMEFPALTTIHLYDLPMLRGIFEVKTTFAPRLHSVRIRGCFNLRRLPAPVAVKKKAQGVRWPTRPTVEVEKDVWDALEWDGADVGHHPTYYEHYRQRGLLRRSVLR
ncbi:hypothetical protein QOZ80_3BG0254890 [Eleusine coracana subsp. coracana]|nr:hypothetical protein QOZ80_3BG0254890 [Eleusine coracana subsp. coracana]